MAAVFCSKAFVINPRLYIGKSAIPAETTDYLWGSFTLVLWALFYYTYGFRRLHPRVGEVAFGLLFGVVNYFGTTIFAYDSWAFVGKTVSWMSVGMKCLGQAFTMMAALTLVSNWFTEQARKQRADEPISLKIPGFQRFYGWYQNHTVLFCFVLFLVSWLPYIIVFYPGTVIYDMCVMVREYFALEPMKTWHSVFTTLIFGSCIWIGRVLGSDNYGTLIYMIFQSTLMAYALACSVGFLRRLGMNRIWQLIALLAFSIVPIWGCYAMMIGKDTLYTATLLLFMLQTLVLAKEGSRGLPRKRDLFFYGVTALLTCLWRNNGLYVILPTAILILCFLIKGKTRLRIALPLVGSVALALLFHQVLVPAAGIIDNSSSGIYSIPFQQTARVARNYANVLTEEEIAEIDAILDYRLIREVYEPWISDPVKDTFRQFGQGADIEKEALKRYQKTWLSMMKKYPVSYIEAFIGNNASYYAFTPKIDGITHNQQAGLRFVFQNYWEPNEGELHTEQPETFANARNFLTAMALRWWTLPVLSMLYVFPFYTWLLIGAALSLPRQRRWRDLVVLMPIFWSFAVCLVSPVDDYLRYYLPIIAMTIPVLAYIAKAPADAGAEEYFAFRLGKR